MLYRVLTKNTMDQVVETQYNDLEHDSISRSFCEQLMNAAKTNVLVDIYENGRNDKSVKNRVLQFCAAKLRHEHRFKRKRDDMYSVRKSDPEFEHQPKRTDRGQGKNPTMAKTGKSNARNFEMTGWDNYQSAKMEAFEKNKKQFRWKGKKYVRVKNSAIYKKVV